MPKVQQSEKRALAAAVLALTMWSGTPIANKVAVSYMGGITAGVLRSMLAGGIALIVALALRLPAPTAFRDRMLLIGSGAASFAIWPAVASIGIEHTTASHAAVIMATIPIFSVLIAHLIQRRLPRAGWWLGALVAFAGTAFLVTNQTSISSTTASAVTGDLIILAGCVVCGMGYVAGGILSAKIGTAATIFWGLASALVLLVPLFSLLVRNTAWTEVPAQGWIAIAWMTVLSSLAGYGLWFYALGTGGISRISSLQLATPAVAIAGAAVTLGEPVTAQMLLAAGVILAGSSWAHRSAR